MALLRREKPQRAISFFGDGAATRASSRKPQYGGDLEAAVIYICENNGWGMSTAVRDVTSGPSIAHRGESYASSTSWWTAQRCRFGADNVAPPDHGGCTAKLPTLLGMPDMAHPRVTAAATRISTATKSIDQNGRSAIRSRATSIA